MEITRKLGIGVVSIIPTFVGGGLMWQIFHGWWAVLLWILIMAFLCGGFLTGRLFGPETE